MRRQERYWASWSTGSLSRSEAIPVSQRLDLLIWHPQLPWQRLYFFPLPQGHLAFRPIFPLSFLMDFFSVHHAQVQAGGCSLCQEVRVVIVDVRSIEQGIWASVRQLHPTTGVVSQTSCHDSYNFCKEKIERRSVEIPIAAAERTQPS